MIFQGLVYMVLGMAVVFAFLIVLVLALKITSRIVSILDRRHPLEEKPGSESAAASSDLAPGEGEAVAAAIGAVVAYHPSLLQIIPKSLPGASAAILPSAEVYPSAPGGDQEGERRRRRIDPWALSGRQSAMKMRTLIQRGLLKR